MSATETVAANGTVDLWIRPAIGVDRKNYPEHNLAVPHGRALPDDMGTSSSPDGQAWTIREVVTLQVPADWAFVDGALCSGEHRLAFLSDEIVRSVVTIRRSSKGFEACKGDHRDPHAKWVNLGIVKWTKGLS